MSGLSWDVPEVWQTGDIARAALRGEHERSGGVVAQVMLTDGTNIIALVFPGGWYALRTSPATDWRVDEQRSGKADPDVASELDEFWADLVAGYVAYAAGVRDEVPGPPQALPDKAFLLAYGDSPAARAGREEFLTRATALGVSEEEALAWLRAAAAQDPQDDSDGGTA